MRRAFAQEYARHPPASRLPPPASRFPPPASQPGANRVGFRDLTTELCRTFFDLDASEVTGIKRLSIR